MAIGEAPPRTPGIVLGFFFQFALVLENDEPADPGCSSLDQRMPVSIEKSSRSIWFARMWTFRGRMLWSIPIRSSVRPL